MKVPKQRDNRELRQRRAMNIVWTAAGAYGFQPAFLAFHEDGTPDLYLNSIIGFAHRFYDEEKLTAYVFRLDRSVLSRVFEDIFWLGLEQAIYKRELPNRPVLEDLRREHARRFLLDSVDVSMQQLMMRSEIIQTLKTGRCREILGEPHGIYNPWDRKLYEALDYPAELTTDEIIARTERILRRFFLFRFTVGSRRSWHIFLSNRWQQWLSRLFSLGGKQEASIRPWRQTDAEGAQAKKRGALSFGGRESLAVQLKELAKVYGKPLFSESVRAKLEMALCCGNHRLAHLYFAIGGENDVSQGNRAFWRENQRQYQQCRRHLRDSLQNSLLIYRQPQKISGRQGRFAAARAWRGIFLYDPDVFWQYQEETHADFAVTLLLDASESRREKQAVIAAQTYAIAMALLDCQIPVQVYSFCSVKGVTVFCRLKSLAERDGQGIFSYRTGGWNRDGLALLAAERLLPQDGTRQQLLMVLTDANPSDVLDVPAGVGRSRHYMDKTAIEDTSKAVKDLRCHGVKLVALVNSVWAGQEAEISARAIYGKQAVAIRSLDRLAESVARLVEQQISRNGG